MTRKDRQFPQVRHFVEVHVRQGVGRPAFVYRADLVRCVRRAFGLLDKLPCALRETTQVRLVAEQ